MTSLHFQPDDPRLTAYALGELDHSERAQVEALFAESAEARVALDGIRETITLLRSELTFESPLTLTSSQRESVAHAAGAAGIEEPASNTRATMLAAKSRWGLNPRMATTVAAVAAVAVMIPLISRTIEFGNSQTTDKWVLAATGQAANKSMPNSYVSNVSGSTSVGRTEKIDRFATEPEVANSRGTAGQLGELRRVESKSEMNESFDSLYGTGDLARQEQLESLGQLIPESRPAVHSGSAGVAVVSDENSSVDHLVGGKTPEQSSESMTLASTLKNESKIELEPGTVAAADGRSVDLGFVESEPRASTSFAVNSPVSGRRMKLSDIDAFGRNDSSRESKEFDDVIDLAKNPSYRFRGAQMEAAPGTEAYDAIIENMFLTPMEQPLSTFSIDVDTASYANSRRFIQQGQLPPRNAIRIEELVNYFRYDYPEPTDGSPFSVNVDVATCPWAPQHKLARVGLKAKAIADDKRPATNLVFLIDVSGSMAAQNKLPLVKQALSVLVSKMGEDDQIAIVTYAGEAGLKLNSTSGSHQNVIQQAIDSLSSGGSTNGAAGINIAYDTAIRSYIKGGANRVILCTDGDFNVGVSDDNTLVEIIQEKAASGVFLSVFGFGMGNERYEA
ncbi:MAG: von Willebrand factor type A domain-containing protein [Planctomycetota bacterium]|nr:von Willebrand factor type A domain-containing protein [Planctomycetota bacterium]